MGISLLNAIWCPLRADWFTLNTKAKQLESSYLLWWCYHTVWSGIGIRKAETEGQSCRCSYATPHEMITSSRLPDKGCLAFISHYFMSDCKISTFFHFVSVWDDPFLATTLYQCVVWLLWRHTIPLTAAQTVQCGVMERGEIDEKGHWLSW